MKIFELEVGGKVVAYSKHKYMLELYLVQRNLETCNFQILRRNIKKGDYVDPELLLYCLGTFVLTAHEHSYVEMLGDEHRTYIENLIIGLEVLAGENARNLSSKDLKAIKRTIKSLKKQTSFTEEESTHILDTITDHPNVVDEYMGQIKFIKSVLRGEC